MMLNSGTNSIVDESRYLAKASSTDLAIGDVVRGANQALDRMNSLVQGVATALQFDDPNHTDQPIATFSTVGGQQSYTLTTDEDGNSILGISKLVITDAGGGYHVLENFNINSLHGDSFLNQYEGAGVPRSFTSVGPTVYLYPTPDTAYTATAYISRNVKYFTTADTTAQPGFAAPFHRLVPLWVAYWYCVREGKTATANALMGEIEALEGEFIEYYADQSPQRISSSYVDPR